MFRTLVAASLLLLAVSASSSGRELLQASSTIGITIPSGCGNVNVASSPSGLRPGCSSSCKTSGALSYSVNQGTSQTVKFSYSSTLVVIGGSYGDQFLSSGDGCDVTAVSANAPTNGVNASTLTSITFAPTTSVCSEFVANTDGQLTFLAFETKGASNPDASTYTTSACKFVVELKLLPNALSSVDASQLFPEANAADALPGSFLKMAAMAVTGGGLMLFMLL